jgi:predicted phage terminase large subunit-like protein
MPKLTKYIAFVPTMKQQAFLCLDCEEAFFGGAAGPGKTSALLMAALMYVDIPGYNAILIRDTYANLSKPEGLIPLAHEWLQNTDAKWKEGDHYKFPSGATLSFGYLSGPMDHFNFQSAAYQFIGIDEVVQIRENQALYMFSRLRRKKLALNIPLRYRCASNPPAREQLIRGAWVKTRYVDPNTRENGVVFISANLADNPYLDVEEYRKLSLSKLDIVTRRQLEDGDWEIQAAGLMFGEEKFSVVKAFDKSEVVASVRYWDKAGTEDGGAFTAGVLIHKLIDGTFVVADVVTGQWSALKRERKIKQTAKIDGFDVDIWIEQEPGSGGKESAESTVRNLAGWNIYVDKVTGSKEVRAEPYSIQAEAGNIKILKGTWNLAFLHEHKTFPAGKFKDQVDAAGGAFNKLAVDNEIFIS